MKIIDIDSNVLHWSDKNCLLAIQYKDKTAAIGVGMLPFFASGIRLNVMVPVKRHEGAQEYEYCGWGFRIIPPMRRAVAQWPRWYRAIWRFSRWSNYDACKVIIRRVR